MSFLSARREVLRALGRHRLGAASRIAVERNVAKKLREVGLDLSFVIRELAGKELLSQGQYEVAPSPAQESKNL